MREDLRIQPKGSAARSALAPVLGLLMVACGSSGSSSNDNHSDAETDAAALDDGSSSMDATQTGMDATQTGIDAAGTGIDGASTEAGAEASTEAGSNEAGSQDATAEAGGVDAAEAGPPACSPTCMDGHACGVAGDCASGVCTNGTCANAACSPSCPDGHVCGASGDCASAVCTNGTCAGPACGPHCAHGDVCGASGDCASGVCTSGTCFAAACAPTCTVGAACGASSDCGSGVCTNDACAAAACAPSCVDKTGCGSNTDCASGVCTGGACAAPACSPTCADGKVCGGNTDCGSGVCINGTCAAPVCSPTCANGAPCGATTDCASGICTSGACAPPSCSPTCAAGNVCGANSDCASDVCSSGTCQATYTFGGVLAGLTPGQSIVLKDQSGNPLTLSANGPFTMTVPVLAGAAYGVTVSTPPSSPIAQTCTVSNGAGTMMTVNVANITVDCDLLAYFPFNGNANDASGYGNNGVVTNATLTTDVAGNANGAYLFGGNANITVSPPSGFLPHGSASRTMTAWLKPTVGQGEWGIVSYGTGNCTALQFGIGLQESATFWGGCDDYASGLAIPLNSWTFVALVYSSATPKTITMYTNGSANVATDTTLGTTLATPALSNLVIGRDNANNADFTGAIDSVRIYGHALTTAEVQAVFSATP